MITGAGLCAACAHMRIVRTRTGSRFHLCMRSRTDPRYPRYPRLPVLRCPGYESATTQPEESAAEGGA